ncbi:DUF3168 domain-containing protein [Pseudochelatococcus sp. B33]
MSFVEKKGPVLALREAVVARLTGDATLNEMLGGARIHDEPPRGIAGVYAVLSDTRLRDWSTGSDRGHEQDFSVTVWASAGGARSALKAAARIEALLHEAALALDGHRLVNLRVTGSDTRRDARANRSRIVLRLRAVTEVVSDN